MVKEDWVAKNWEFLKTRRIQVVRSYRFTQDFIRNPQVSTQGKFYGDSDYYENSPYKGSSMLGKPRLLLRPYIVAPTPEEGVRAVYIDPKKYEFNNNGVITKVADLYENVIFIFKD